MSRILIVTAHYHPFVHPRAHRWTSLAEYWAAKGHTVHVVTGRQRGYGQTYLEQGGHIHRTGYTSLKELLYHLMGDRTGRGRVGAPVGKPGIAGRLLGWLYTRIWRNICFPDDACIWYLPARRKTLALLASEPFDVLITVALPFTDHLVGLAAKRRYPGLRWIADTGDPFSIQDMSLNNKLLYGRLSRRLERLVLGRADVLAVTTDATADKYRQAFGPSVGNLTVIPPLLHPAPLPLEHRADVETGLLKLAYFGAMYRPLRTPEALLELIRSTIQARPDLASRLELHFYGEIFPEFYDMLQVEPWVRLHGLQSRETVRRAMQESDILVSIGNTSDFQLPSKSVEYLASGKRVLHLSYTERDCFVEFWGDAAGLYVVDVIEGKVRLNNRSEWLNWITQAAFFKAPDDMEARLHPFLVNSIGKAYERWFI